MRTIISLFAAAAFVAICGLAQAVPAPDGGEPAAPVVADGGTVVAQSAPCPNDRCPR